MAGIPSPVFRGLILGEFIANSIPSAPPSPTMAEALQPDRGLPPRPGPAPTRIMSEAIGASLNPAKMEIWDLSRWQAGADDEGLPMALQVHFNPKELRESLKVVWNEINIPGLSHSRLTYARTENVGYKFDLVFDALQIAGGSKQCRGYEGDFGISRARSFLQSLCFPRDGGDSILDGAPPRVLLFWPNFLSLQCVAGSQDFAYTHFFADGSPRRFTCSMELKEIRDVRLTSTSVLRGQRNSTPPDDNHLIRIS
jgi:hypothetical protein